MICLSFRDKYDILLEKSPSGVAELRYIMVYGKCQLMRRITEKPDLMNTIAVKVWTQVGISSTLEPANLVFRINLQENTSEKRNIDSSG